MNPDLYITPAGTLRLGAIDSPPENLSKAAWTRLHKAFHTSPAAGMLALATDLLNTDLPANFIWCRTFAQRYLTALCQTAALAGNEPLPVVPQPTPELLNERLQTRPTMFGGEYLTTYTARLVVRTGSTGAQGKRQASGNRLAGKAPTRLARGGSGDSASGGEQTQQNTSVCVSRHVC